MKKPRTIVVDSSEVPRTSKNRQKNWQCLYKNCIEPPKTRYNCCSHVWDAHLRRKCCKNNDPQYENVSYKALKNKTVVNELCINYMRKLVIKKDEENQIKTENKSEKKKAKISPYQIYLQHKISNNYVPVEKKELKEIEEIIQIEEEKEEIQQTFPSCHFDKKKMIVEKYVEPPAFDVSEIDLFC